MSSQKASQSGPFIVTTLRKEPAIPVKGDNGYSVNSRVAVATLENVRVGRRPDGALVEVEPISWHRMCHGLPIGAITLPTAAADGDASAQACIISAYNAANGADSGA